MLVIDVLCFFLAVFYKEWSLLSVAGFGLRSARVLRLGFFLDLSSWVYTSLCLDLSLGLSYVALLTASTCEAL